MTHQEYERRLRAVFIEQGEIADIAFLEGNPTPVDGDGCALLPLPPRCRVTYKLYPSEQSDITCVLVLPLTGWNKRFLGTGNGGQAGSIVWGSLDAGVSHGFATANTDMGSSLDSRKMYRCPERWLDFAHRATHLMTAVGKQLTEAFYGEKIGRAYFLGGSTGGNQALQEAQKYPEDYDGIVAVCPARNRYYLQQSFPWIVSVTCSDPSAVFTKEQIAALKRRIVEKYAVLSGSAEGDNFLSYPGKVKFTPADVEALCEGLGLNEAQKKVLKDLHSAPVDPERACPLFFTPPLGSEPSSLIIPYLKDGFIKLLGFFQRWGYGEDAIEVSYEEHKAVFGPYQREFDASDPDLSAFQARGGKLIMITGSEDSLIPYTDGLAYYQSVLEEMGGEETATNFFRYFHVPGLGHCQGGSGLQEIGAKGGIAAISYDAEHDAVCAVMTWAEKGIAPEVLYASAFEEGDMKGTVDYERPVYPYPYETKYTGGDRKDKNHFTKVRGNGRY